MNEKWWLPVVETCLITLHREHLTFTDAYSTWMASQITDKEMCLRIRQHLSVMELVYHKLDDMHHSGEETLKP